MGVFQVSYVTHGPISLISYSDRTVFSFFFYHFSLFCRQNFLEMAGQMFLKFSGMVENENTWRIFFFIILKFYSRSSIFCFETKKTCLSEISETVKTETSKLCGMIDVGDMQNLFSILLLRRSGTLTLQTLISRLYRERWQMH